MREAAITLLACAMVLVPAPVALASQQSAAVAAVPGGAREAVEPRAEGPGKPSSSPTASPDDPEESEEPDDPREPDDPEETERPPRFTLPPWPPGDSSPDPDPSSTPTPTPEPSSGEPSGEPSGTAPGGDGDEERGPTESAGPPDTPRQTPQGRAEQIVDRRSGGGDHYDDYVYDDGQSGDEPARHRATPATGGQLLPVLPLGAGLTFLGLGLASLALRLRR
ncbi:hypothetical protein L7D48_06160 [Streptomyces sp. S1A]|uniref:hypothetical protein n=1 Tax=Streptomyces sp. ICN903 TaxID=2964654 RepID=UPI001EDBE6B7|nr:hypothetical protein [Streptomyces sp. ICN903]MCG3040152.1 hypothetical protein [Streptomyces sp. ICN903]